MALAGNMAGDLVEKPRRLEHPARGQEPFAREVGRGAFSRMPTVDQGEVFEERFTA